MSESTKVGRPSAGAASTPGLPEVVDRAAFQADLDRLRAREKAHTRAGDAIAAARRRLPMVELDPAIPLAGPDGPVTLLEAFEGRRRLIAYYFMWHAGRPAAEQCEGCTFYNGQIGELSYLHSRDVTYATFCQGPYEESARYRDFMGWDMPWYSAHASLGTLLAGRQTGLFHLVCYLRARVLPAGRRPRLRDLLDDPPRRRGDGPQLRAHGPHRVRDARSPGRTRHPAGRDSAPTRGVTAGRPPGHQCRCGRADAPSPNGRDSEPDAPTTSAPAAAEQIRSCSAATATVRRWSSRPGR
jgi:hypothetical protein